MSNRTLPLSAALFFLFAAARPADAQRVEAVQGVQKPGTRVPAQFDAAPPTFTPEQLRELEEEMNEANVLGPPLRVETGAVVGAPSVPGTPIAAGAISPFAARPQGAAPNAAGTFSLYRATSPGPYSPATSTIAETSAGAAGPVVFMTGNWFGAYSTNNGSTFSYVNPFTQFASLDGGFCLEALDEALSRGRPEIFNTDQGSQFTSREYTGRLEGAGVAVSRDGRGRALDNVFVERLWRSVKYEDIYIKDYEAVPELELGLAAYFRFYDEERPHQSLGYRTPAEVYRAGFRGG